MYVFEDLHTWEWICVWGGLVCVRGLFGRSLALPIFIPFSTILLPYAVLTHLFGHFLFEHHCIILVIFILTSKYHIPRISLEP